MRYSRFATERVVGGAIVSHVDIRLTSRAAAERVAREHTSRLSSRQAKVSVIRLLGWQHGTYGAMDAVPLAAFHKHPISGRVTRV